MCYMWLDPKRKWFTVIGDIMLINFASANEEIETSKALVNLKYEKLKAEVGDTLYFVSFSNIDRNVTCFYIGV